MSGQVVARLAYLSGRNLDLLSKTIKPAHCSVPAISHIYWHKSKWLSLANDHQSLHTLKNAFHSTSGVSSDQSLITGNRCISNQIVSSLTLGHKRQFHTTSKRFDHDPRILELKKTLSVVFEKVKDKENPAQLATEECKKLIKKFHNDVSVTTPFSKRLNKRRRLLFQLHPMFLEMASNELAQKVNTWSHKDGRNCIMPKKSEEVNELNYHIYWLKKKNQAELKEYTFHVHVVDHDAIKYSACSYLTDMYGYIWMSRFEINKYSENILASAVAHEMGHVVLRHHQETKCNEVFFKISVVNSAMAIQRCCDIDKNSKKPVEYVKEIVATVEDLIPNIKDKGRNELEADQASAYFCHKAQYNPQEFIKWFLEREEWETPKNENKSKAAVTQPAQKRTLAAYVNEDIENYINEIDLEMKHPPYGERRIAYQMYLDKLKKDPSCTVS